MISENLREASFIVCQKEKKEPFGAGDWNDKVISYEKANEMVKEGFNIGIPLGQHDFFAIDCDTLELSQACEGLLPKTYVEQTCSGGYHYIYRIKDKMDNLDIKNEKRHFGEIKSHRVYIVVAPSKAINKSGVLEDYSIIQDREVPYITKEQIKEVLIQFMKPQKDKIEVNESAVELLEKYKINQTDKWIYDIIKNNILIKQDTGGNSIVFKNSAIILTRENIKDEEMRIIAKAIADSTENYPLSKLYGWIKKAKNNELAQVNEKEVDKFIERSDYPLTKYKDYKIVVDIPEEQKLPLKDIAYFKKIKKSKDFLIEVIQPNKVLSLVYAPPKHNKSLYELEKCLCLASGRKFLNKFKVKKSNVLILDYENSEFILRDRILKIMKANKITRCNGIYFLTREKYVDILNPIFLEKLKKVIKEYKIKYLVVDTLPKASNYDTNSEKDVNRIYSSFFLPLLELGCSPTFLLHTNKSGNSFIGSQAYLGIVDCSYEITKSKPSSNKIIIHSNNRGENVDFGIEYEFTEDEIKTYYYDVESDKPLKINKMKELTQKIMGYFNKGSKLQKKDIEVRLNNDNYEYSNATLKRVLSFLVEVEKLEKDTKGDYWLR